MRESGQTIIFVVHEDSMHADTVRVEKIAGYGRRRCRWSMVRYMIWYQDLCIGFTEEIDMAGHPHYGWVWRASCRIRNSVGSVWAWIWLGCCHRILVSASGLELVFVLAYTHGVKWGYEGCLLGMAIAVADYETERARRCSTWCESTYYWFLPRKSMIKICAKIKPLAFISTPHRPIYFLRPYLVVRKVYFYILNIQSWTTVDTHFDQMLICTGGGWLFSDRSPKEPLPSSNYQITHFI